MNDFINKAKSVHGDKYDYSLVNYLKSDYKVDIICPIHGIFKKTQYKHLVCKEGCQKCNGYHKLTNDEFIIKAKSIHGDKYDYSNINYLSNKSKLNIICPIHGLFTQTSNEHFNSYGCAKCATIIGSNKIKSSNNNFINKARLIHENKYDYLLVEYVNSKTKVKISCKKHGVWYQTPNNHLSGKGCPICKIEGNKLTFNKFISKANSIHSNKYDYSSTIFIDMITKINIICPIHGCFRQAPKNHLYRKQGCPICNESIGEKIISEFLIKNNISFVRQKKFNGCKNIHMLPFDFYLPDYNICLEFQGEQHFNPIKKFGGINKFEKRKLCDNIKLNYCQNKNIALITICYDEDIMCKLIKIFHT